MSLGNFNTSMDAGFLLLGVLPDDDDSTLGIRALMRSTMNTIVQTNSPVRFSVTRFRSTHSHPVPAVSQFTEPVGNLDNLDYLLNAANPLHDEYNLHGTISICKKKRLQMCYYFPLRPLQVMRCVGCSPSLGPLR